MCPPDYFDPISKTCWMSDFTIPVANIDTQHKVLELYAKYGDGWLDIVVDFFYSIIM